MDFGNFFFFFFAHDIFWCISVNQNYIMIKILLKFDPKNPTDNNPQTYTKPSPEPMTI